MLNLFCLFSVTKADVCSTAKTTNAAPAPLSALDVNKIITVFETPHCLEPINASCSRTPTNLKGNQCFLYFLECPYIKIYFKWNKFISNVERCSIICLFWVNKSCTVESDHKNS